MIVIYAEKASLAKAIAVALKAGNRIPHPKEPTIGHYEFTFNGEEAKDDEPVIRRKHKENRVIKPIKEVFWI